jgi:tRNA(fMet)-specific endonuclease VapC
LRRSRDRREIAAVYQRLTNNVKFLARVRILSFSEEAIARYEDMRTQKLGIRAMDLRIAAIALEHGATVVTGNVRDFQRVPGLTVVSWS